MSSIKEDVKYNHKLRSKVAKALMTERWFKEMGQQELADLIGTQKSSISRIEKGEQNITVDYIEMIAKALDKDVSFVMEDHKIGYGDYSEYYLKIYDEVLLRFSLTRDLSLSAKILDINESMRHLFPLDLELTDEGLLTWLRKRTVPGSRELIGNVLNALGLSLDNLKGIVDVSMSLSLNDSYWVPQISFEKSFGEMNLYQNKFDEILSLIAYTGYGSKKEGYGTTPELTTDGMLRKGWYYSDTRGIWLYKSGTSGFANAGNEPYSELHASQVAERMGLNHVHYQLENYHGIIASKCELFTNIDTSYIPIGRIVKDGGIEACLDYYKELGDSFYQELVSMLVFDAVIINEDRHFGNFGLLRSNHTGEIIAPAPIFDNGLSLLAYAIPSDFQGNIREYVASRTNPYGRENQFMDLAKRVMGPKQKKELRKLINFEFPEAQSVDLPSWRLRALEDIIQERVQELLKA